jgi:response regulator RpfG family c-di-GMP phosphodiesterase
MTRQLGNPAEDQPNGARGRILVVDDESIVCDTVGDILSADGYVCDRAYLGTKALEYLATNSYDCLISDIRMPTMGGVELAKRARVLDSDLAIVLMTGLVDTETARVALRSEVNDYLVKPFDIDDLRHCVNSVIEHRSLVLENREYQQKLEEKVTLQAATIRRQFLSAIQSLAKAVEARDPYTRGHSDRVSDFASLVAAHLGLSSDERDLVQQAGLLHDIGKIGIPDSILQKNGPLSRAEWGIMQMHPLVGRNIIAQIEPPPMLLEGALSHHERWDGKGYPRGLARTEIPLIGRILAAADAFDAMTSARPYRPAFSTEEALVRLREGRGSHLDAEIVDVAIPLFERRRARRVPETAQAEFSLGGKEDRLPVAV